MYIEVYVVLQAAPVSEVTAPEYRVSLGIYRGLVSAAGGAFVGGNCACLLGCLRMLGGICCVLVCGLYVACVGVSLFVPFCCGM